MNEPLADCEGGGGTTALDGSGIVPPAKRCVSGERSAEGGGATTEDAGKFSFEFRPVFRSGAETGGGTTAAFVIWTGELERSRLTPPGAGGITLPASAGLDRLRSRSAVGAGATTDVLSIGACSPCSRAALGAGGITAGPRAGATRLWLLETLGAGGISVALKLGAVVVRSRVTDGAGAITESSCTPLRV